MNHIISFGANKFNSKEIRLLDNTPKISVSCRWYRFDAQYLIIEKHLLLGAKKLWKIFTKAKNIFIVMSNNLVLNEQNTLWMINHYIEYLLPCRLRQPLCILHSSHIGREKFGRSILNAWIRVKQFLLG